MKKEVAILTKSSKHKGYCVAGIDMRTGGWIRLVSDDEQTHGALSPENISYWGKRVCEPLDVVSVEVIRPEPFGHQSENYLIDTRKRWKKLGACSLANILAVHPAEIHPYLFGNSCPFVDSSEISSIRSSLSLIEAFSLVIRKTTNTYGKPKTKADFVYNRRPYRNISVTDPHFYDCPDGAEFPGAYLVVSLPDAPFPEDRYYKFIASIYPQ